MIQAVLQGIDLRLNLKDFYSHIKVLPSQAIFLVT